MAKSIFLFGFSALLVVITAVNYEGAKEQACFPIKNTVRVDADWLRTAKQLYYPMMSRLELYTTGLEITQKTKAPMTLPESDIYYDGCFKVKIFAHNNTLEATGFGGLKTVYDFEPQNIQAEIENKGRHFVTASGQGGRNFVTMTDNSTFFFVAYCMDDDQMTWGVTTTIKELPIETVQLIHEHAVSLGFKPEYFERIRYDTCYEEQDDMAPINKLAI